MSIRVARGATGGLDEVQVGLDAIEGTLRDLESRLSELQQRWDGDAREAFADASRKWNRQIEALNGIAHAARRRAQQHVDTVGSHDARRATAWTR
ncbi:WXG100 family type VII secretion target [Leucobacter sp. USHLN153]|uniref:WXG100 family type VII secretion target n=1 Tax=Leucobacter sp. USHLN153 TaxID=3081268 RepID=UPI0030174777